MQAYEAYYFKLFPNAPRQVDHLLIERLDGDDLTAVGAHHGEHLAQVVVVVVCLRAQCRRAAVDATARQLCVDRGERKDLSREVSLLLEFHHNNLKFVIFRRSL